MMSYKKQIIFLIISVLICISLIISIFIQVKKSAVREMNARQMIYARLAANSIESFLSERITTLQVFARNPHIIAMDKEGKELFRMAHKIAGPHIQGMTRLNAQGDIIYTFPPVPHAIGTNISGQDHVRNALHTHQLVISDIFETVQGFKSVAIHVPVYRDKTFDGTIGYLISFSGLAKDYLDDLYIPNNRFALLINAHGKIVHGITSDHPERAWPAFQKDSTGAAAGINRMMKGEEGEATFLDKHPEGGTKGGERKHVVYTPVRAGNGYWSVALISSETFMLPSVQSIRNQIIILALILISFFAITIYIAARIRSESVAAQARRKIEGDLIKSAREVHDLYHNAPCGYHSLDSSGNIVRINDTELSWLGYEREELLGRPFSNILSSANREHVDLALTHLKKRGFIHEVEYEIMRKDGSIFPVLITASALTDAQGNFVMSRSMVVDITARKQAEGRLRESEALYRTAMETINDGVSIIQDGLYVYTNRKLLNTIGRPDENLVGQPLGVFVHPDDQEFVKKMAQARLEGKPAPSRYELRIIKPDNSIIILDITAVLITYEGKPAALACIQDITERKQIETALRESEERYRTIIENIDDEYFETDLTGKLTFSNKPFGWSCYSRNELLNMDNRSYATPEMARKIYREFNIIYRSGTPARITDYEIIRKDGNTGHLEMSVSLIRDAEGKPTGFRGISRDVSERFKMEEERKKLTEQLHQAQKMEAIGTLAGGIAHDFNNLLMGIQGYTSLMLLEVEATHPHYEQLQAVQTLVQSGANLTRQLLGFARAGRYEAVPTNLNDLIGKSINLFGRTRKEIRIFEKYTETIWTVEADRGQIEQVLLNMFVNAWQAMPGGGSLYLETENAVLDDALAKIHDLKPGQYVKTSITDTGVGMDEKTRQRIFDPFFTTKEMGRGTGLGLASAYGIIKGHRGMITVYSEKGQGTTFNIYLPASLKEANAEEPTEQEPTGGWETILLVDDEKVITDVTGNLLTELGYQIITAASGDQAIAIYAQRHAKIDLVIIDMIMPGMSGSDTFDQLIALNPSVRVILSSGYSLSGKAQAIMDRGVRAFLQKPYRLHDLAQKIREALAD
jgi:two-component system, cell cycle sensor histidine kinase and response regulator CckA